MVSLSEIPFSVCAWIAVLGVAFTICGGDCLAMERLLERRIETVIERERRRACSLANQPIRG
jgi:hypothetical protein